jgi:rubredoxin
MEQVKRPMYRCPGCGYIVDEIVLTHARFDFNCPRCAASRLSEFKKVKENDGSEVRNRPGD